MNLSQIKSNKIKKPRLLLGLGGLITVAMVVFTQLTSNTMTGWTSGFLHPLHGSDHFLAMLAVGIWAAQIRGSAIWLLPLTFVGVMSLGGIVGATGFLLPGAEAVILGSCIAFLVLICKRVRFSHPINVAIVAFFAFFHGFAHGQEISTSASLISYTLGFMVATLLLHGTGIIIVRLLIAVCALLFSHIAYAHSGTSDDQTAHSVKSTVIQSVYGLANQRYANTSLCSAEHKTIRSQTYVVLKPPPQRLDKLIDPHPLFGISTQKVYLLATSFLTNGVGATSPPTAYLIANLVCLLFVTTLDPISALKNLRLRFAIKPSFSVPLHFTFLAQLNTDYLCRLVTSNSYTLNTFIQ